MFTILVDIQGGHSVSPRLQHLRFHVIVRATDISRANIAFEIVHRAQYPCSEVVPEDEGLSELSFEIEIISRSVHSRSCIILCRLGLQS